MGSDESLSVMGEERILPRTWFQKSLQVSLPLLRVSLMKCMFHMMKESRISAQGKTGGSSLVLGFLFLGMVDKNQKKDIIRPFRKHWIRISCHVSLIPCQGWGFNLGREIHSRQMICHCHQETRLKWYFQKVHKYPPRHWGCYWVTRNIHHQTTLTDEQTYLPHSFFSVGAHEDSAPE